MGAVSTTLRYRTLFSKHGGGKDAFVHAREAVTYSKLNIGHSNLYKQKCSPTVQESYQTVFVSIFFF